MENSKEKAFILQEKKSLSYLQRLIITSRTTSMQGHMNGKALIPAELLFENMKNHDSFNYSEQMFIQLLHLLKERSAVFYGYLEIPEKWKGQSIAFFPESQPSKNKSYCKVMNSISVQEIYDFTDEKRVWNKNERVWVPSDDPSVLSLLEDGMLKLLF
jgi:hypothetical protein